MNRLNYNPGGLTVPRGYRAYPYPYGDPPAGATGRLYMKVLSAILADYDGKEFTLRRNEADGSYTAVTFGFYVAPSLAPAPPIVGIDLTGLVGTIAIANRIAQVVEVDADFRTGPPGLTNLLIIEQPFGGSQGDVGVFADFTAGTELQIGSGLSFGAPDGPNVTLTQYGDTVFFGSTELTVPLRIGYIFGMGPTTSRPVSNGSFV